MAGIDKRLLDTLRAIRDQSWSYNHFAPSRTLLQLYSQELGFPRAWGDPTVVPAFGGSAGNAIWDNLGVKHRRNIGGVPCELVHRGYGHTLGLEHSCTANAGLRGMHAFLQALVIYLPVRKGFALRH